jgi:hypothetical protein
VLEQLWESPRPKQVISDGAQQVAEWLAGKLGL